VDAADYTLWRDSQGASAAGDADFDGDTDQADYLAWSAAYGFQRTPLMLQSVLPAESAAAPEPLSSGLALLLLVGLAAGRAMRRF
ncbi:MAG: hypothetical protein KDA37_12185, partial [Planctomycetales bacterium]|nr:hypothetical protein [Planctomycetales bacterium]